MLAGQHGTTVITADLRDPDAVLGHPDLRSMIDFGAPVALLMTAVLHFVADGSDPAGLLRRYRAALAPGSYLALSHATADRLPPAAAQAILAVYENASEHIYLRDRASVARFFEGTELVPPHDNAAPDLSYVGEWGAEDPTLADSDGSRVLYCGVGRCL